MRSGYVRMLRDITRKVLRDVGNTSYGWTPSAIEGSTSIQAYFIEIAGSYILPSNGPSDRSYGFSLRCLSTTAVGKR